MKELNGPPLVLAPPPPFTTGPKIRGPARTLASEPSSSSIQSSRRFKARYSRAGLKPVSSSDFLFDEKPAGRG